MTRFTKAHACGNDFLVVEQPPSTRPEQARALAMALCARNTGIGADGVEFVTWTGDRAATIRLYNADGSLAEISGNGTRCVAAVMANARAMPAGEVLTLATDAGMRECHLIEVHGRGQYEIATRMGIPKVELGTIVLPGHSPDVSIVVDGAIVSTGNPHFVILVEDETFRAHGLSWQDLGAAICTHPHFTQQTNVEFVRIRSRHEIAIRIFERGVGPTTSSGTGTCACSAAAVALHGGAADLLVEAPGGAQRTSWHGPDEEMLLTGPASIIAHGEAFLTLPGLAAGA